MFVPKISRNAFWWSVFKWVIVLSAYLFLAYKLIHFNQYPQLAAQWQQTPGSQFLWLAFVLVLLPINWLLESIKWKTLTSNVQKLSVKKSLKAVLSGVSTGFFTPNRVGELVGRVLFLKTDNRKAGITLCVLNSFTQNIIISVCGIPACVLFFKQKDLIVKSDINLFILLLSVFIVVFVFLYFAMPFIIRRFSIFSLSSKVAAFTSCLSTFSFFDLVQIMLISLLRYAVFCSQFYFMLRFFGVELSITHALISILCTYLFVTVTPTVAFSELAIRSSFAVFFVGAFSGEIIGIALAGGSLWLVNFVLPMLVGSVIVLRTKINNLQNA